MERKKIILDVDTGTDDAVAIAVAALSEKLEVLGITVTHGNQPLCYTLENTLRMVEFLKLNIPVYAGCNEPMVQYLTAGRLLNVRRQTIEKVINGETVSIHQKYLDLPKASIQAEAKHACSFLVETLKHTTEKITIVAVGPLTNIAMALRMDPSICKGIEEIVIMGGAIAHGNRTPVAEANFYDDPEAAQIVLKSGCKIRLFTLDATESVLCGHEEAEEFRKTSYVGQFVGDLTEEFVRKCTLLNICDCGKVSIHDAVTVCAVIDPSIVTDLRHQFCDVDFSGGFSDGQLVVDTRMFAKPADPVYVAYKVDRDRCLELMLHSLKHAETEAD